MLRGFADPDQIIDTSDEAHENDGGNGATTVTFVSRLLETLPTLQRKEST